MLPDWKITEDEDGTRHAVGGPINVTVVPDGKSKMWKRNGIKNVGSGNPDHVRWLVAELDGVRVYYNGQSLIVTKQDLYP